MKSLEELQAIRDNAKLDMEVRNDKKVGYEVIVGMGECGIAAGAREIVPALMECVVEKELANVTVKVSDCVGKCDKEPVVTVLDPEGKKTLYGQMDAAKIKEVIAKHVINGEVVAGYLL